MLCWTDWADTPLEDTPAKEAAMADETLTQEKPDTPLEGADAKVDTSAAEQTPPPDAPAPAKDTPADARVASLEQTIRQLEGRIAKAETPADVHRLEAQLEKQRRQLEKVAIRLDPTITEEETAKRLKALDDEEKQAASSESLVSYARKIAAWIKDDLDDAGLTTDHPKVKEALERWKAGRTPEDFDTVYSDIKAFARVEKQNATKRQAAEAAKVAEAERKKENRENGTLDVATSVGSAVAPNRPPTREDLMKKAKDVHFMSPKELAEFNAQWKAAK